MVYFTLHTVHQFFFFKWADSLVPSELLGMVYVLTMDKQVGGLTV